MAEVAISDPDTYKVLAPLLLLVGAAMLAFLIDSVDPDSTNYRLVAGTSIAGTLAALGVTIWYIAIGVGVAGDPEEAGVQGLFELFGGSLIVDQMALLFVAVVTSVTALVLVASYDYLEDQPHAGEFYSLVLLAATGMATMAMADSFVTAFIALELASLPSFALVAFLKDNRGSVEAGLKYFLIGALSSAIFLYGISLVYVSTGRLQFGEIATSVAEGGFDQGIFAIGVLMIVGGLAYKTASVPFHFWAPEAYEGAPAPISAFLSSASKAAGFVLAFRVFVEAFPIASVANGIEWMLVFQVLAVVTMVLGNFAAAVQDNVKRMLAYSSIGHAGYALIGLAALTGGGAYNDFVLGSAMLHLLVYGFMNTGAFLFIALAEHWEVGRTFEDFNGLATKAPVASLAMTVFLFNLAGLPIGAGFISKYFLFGSAVTNGIWWLAAVGAITSALSLYYYSRLAKAMWIEDPADDLRIESQPVGLYTAVIAAAVVTVALLVAFNPVVSTAVDAAGALLA
ncbi:NADH-quinone oxidoreductase subunit N [Natronoarchaeum mannanilyticum]|uniref:NADH-quinone oxidoreductase subunit N n=1 Tax=Natronoarchaeum mannanilyticum TaxID=926360 RepID=A0AAV3T3U0_9EURY